MIKYYYFDAITESLDGSCECSQSDSMFRVYVGENTAAIEDVRRACKWNSKLLLLTIWTSMTESLIDVNDNQTRLNQRFT